jgi:N-acetylglucosaminyl-diphospho-decaprenol L-rhamnosyltransferase
VTTARIAVVVPSFESASQLPRCLDSLRPLADAGHRVVVVDNASSDDSARVVRERYPWATLRTLERNLGFAAACNRGAMEAPGADVLFLNADAWLDGGGAETLAAALSRRPDLGAVGPRLAEPGGGRQFTWEPTPSLIGEGLRRSLLNPLERRAVAHGPARAVAAVLGDAGFLTAACLLVRRAAFDEVGGFDERYFLYFEDADLGVRLRRAGWRLDVEPRARAWHLRGASRGPATEVHYRRSQFLFYREHRPRWESRALVRRQRRRFARLDDADLRRELLAVCDQAAAALDD